MTGPLAPLFASRFWSKVDRRGPDECWPWTASLNFGGYGRFALTTSRTVVAHRVAYELEIGPIPDGLTIDHLCRNRSCCNPAHLEAVTMRENVLRGDGPSAQNARRTVCKRGHPLEGDNLKITSQGRVCRKCFREMDRRWHARMLAQGRSPSYDTCPECGERKTKQAALCRSCYDAERRLNAVLLAREFELETAAALSAREKEEE